MKQPVDFWPSQTTMKRNNNNTTPAAAATHTDNDTNHTVNHAINGSQQYQTITQTNSLAPRARAGFGEQAKTCITTISDDSFKRRQQQQEQRSQLATRDHVSLEESVVLSIRDEQYALYSYRWFILFAITMFALIVGLERSFLSVMNLVYEHIGTDVYGYTQWQPSGMCVLLFLGVPLSRALDRFGLRWMAYFASFTTIVAHLLISLALMPDDHWLSVQKPYRFGLLIAGNIGVQVVFATEIGFAAKVAPTWFAENEATRVMMIWGSGYSIAAGLTNHFVPKLVTHEHQLDVIAYIYLSIAFVACISTVCIIRRSEPEKAPSSKAHESNEGSQAPLFKSLYVILTCPQYVLVLFAATVNTASINFLFSVLENVLEESGYSNNFCGSLISMFFLIGIPASFLSAIWVDKSGHFVVASKLAAVLHPIFLMAFLMAIQNPGQTTLIVGCCFLISLSMGLVVQSFIQVQLRASAGIIAGTSIMAMTNIILALVFTLMCSLLKPLSNLSPEGHRNAVPLNTLGLFSICSNFVYVIFYAMPDKEQMRQRMTFVKLEKTVNEVDDHQKALKGQFRYIEPTN